MKKAEQNRGQMTSLWTLLKARINFTPGKGRSSLANYTCSEEAGVLKEVEKGMQKGKAKKMIRAGQYT